MYTLSHHTFLCPVGAEILLLDLKHDRYLALNAGQASLLGEFLRGWPTSLNQDKENSTLLSTDAAALAGLLQEQELVTPDDKAGKPFFATEISSPTNEMFKTPFPTSIKPRPLQVLALTAATLLSAALLRWCPIEKVVARVSKRRSTHGHRTADPRTTRELVNTFFRLRPFLFRSNNACLFDSLTLLHFLGWFGVFPQWVFGVRNDPFAAHCWVQQGENVLNDSVEHVLRYKPIMVV